LLSTLTIRLTSSTRWGLSSFLCCVINRAIWSAFWKICYLSWASWTRRSSSLLSRSSFFSLALCPASWVIYTVIALIRLL
jgi:hypothetical protein